MRMAIAGGGVAGSYLAARLASHIDVEVFDPLALEEIGRDCGWGTNYELFMHFCRMRDLLPDDYVLAGPYNHRSGPYTFNDACVIHKPRFLLDLRRSAEVTLRCQRLEQAHGNWDLVVDATGRCRSLLPRCPERADWMLPCYQVDVESRRMPDHAAIRRAGVGYLWAFPTHPPTGRGKIGCGSFTASPREEVVGYLDEKLGRTPASVLDRDTCAGTLRMLPPSGSRPVYVGGSPPVVGVGEAVGAVNPLNGEGIGPSLLCADYLANHILRARDGAALDAVLSSYAEGLREHFRWIERRHGFMRSVRFGGRAEQLFRLLRLSTWPYSFAHFRRLRNIKEVLLG